MFDFDALDKAQEGTGSKAVLSRRSSVNRSSIGSTGATGGAQTGPACEVDPDAGTGEARARDCGAELADSAQPKAVATDLAVELPRSLDTDAPAAGPGSATACSLPDEAKRGLEFASGVAREYVWCETRDAGGERSEATLRIQPNGQWWHAAHLSRRERAKVMSSRTVVRKCWYRSESRSQSESSVISDGLQDLSSVGSSQGEDVDVWEMAESLGSWEAVRLSTGSWGILLTCEHCRWSSDRPSATPRLRPAPQMRKDTEKLLDSGKYIICFALSGAEVGRGCLKLESSQLPPVEGLTKQAFQRNVQVAYQALGFARSYDESVPQSWNADGAAPAGSVPVAVEEPAAEVGGKSAG